MSKHKFLIPVREFIGADNHFYTINLHDTIYHLHGQRLVQLFGDYMVWNYVVYQHNRFIYLL